MAGKSRRLVIAGAAILGSCSDASRVTGDPTPTSPQAAIATSCTRDAQASIFRPQDFSSLANRSTIVVLGQVAAQSLDVVTIESPESTPLPTPAPSSRFDEANVRLPPETKDLHTPSEFRVTWVESTIDVEHVIFASSTEPREPVIVVRTMAEGPTCDRLDAVPLKSQRYVFFLSAFDVAPDDTRRYSTTGGSWAGRFLVAGDTLQPDTPEGASPSRAATQVAAGQLSSLAHAIATARRTG